MSGKAGVASENSRQEGSLPLTVAADKKKLWVTRKMD